MFDYSIFLKCYAIEYYNFFVEELYMLSTITRHIRLPIKKQSLNYIPKHTHKNNIRQLKQNKLDYVVFFGLLRIST